MSVENIIPSIETCCKVLFVAFLFFNVQETLSPSCVAQSPGQTRISRKSVGPIRLGMTVARVRKALPGAKLSRTSDGEGVALIAVERRGKTLMTLYAGEDDPSARINERGVVEVIEVWTGSYSTSSGVRPRMSLRDVEKRYGKLKEIMMSEIESREYATFVRQPSGIQFRVRNDNGTAGVYQEGQNTSKSYAPRSYVFSILITK